MATEKQPDKEAQELALVERVEQFERFMRECRECQKDVAPDWHFCAHCGVRRSTACPRCQEPLPPAGATSCAHCGFAIPQIDV
jgi:hypothetical protein